MLARSGEIISLAKQTLSYGDPYEYFWVYNDLKYHTTYSYIKRHPLKTGRKPHPWSAIIIIQHGSNKRRGEARGEWRLQAKTSRR